VLSEKDLIEGCKQNEAVARQLLYEKYARLMFGVCSRYIGNADDLRDVVQDSFVKVFTNIKKFRYEGSFEGWMKRIFVNTAINYLKENKKYRNKMDIDDPQGANLIADDSREAYRTMDRRDIDSGKVDYNLVSEAELSHEELLEALNSIPEGFRVVFNLACIEGMKHEEIAEMMNIDASTSRTRLTRARAMLQKIIYEKSVEKVSRY